MVLVDAFPAGTQRNKNVFITSKRRRWRRFDVMKMLSLRHYCVMCPLGWCQMGVRSSANTMLTRLLVYDYNATCTISLKVHNVLQPANKSCSGEVGASATYWFLCYCWVCFPRVITLCIFSLPTSFMIIVGMRVLYLTIIIKSEV